MSVTSMMTLDLLASTLTPTVPFPTATTSLSQVPMDTDFAGVFHRACLDLHNYKNGKCGPTTSSSALCCGESLTMCECASTFCSGSPTRSLAACGSAVTNISLLDEPAYIIAKPSSDITSSDEVSSKSAISTTSSGISSPRTSTSTVKSSLSLNTESSTTSRKKSTSSTSASISSRTKTSSPTTSSSVSSSGATTTSPGSSIPSETGHTGLSPGTPTSETPAVVQTLYSTLKPTTPTYSVGGPTNAPIGADTSALSTGAKAGIGVGAGAGLLLLLTAVMLVLFKKRRTRDEPPQQDAWPMGDQQPPSTSTTQSSRPGILSHQQHSNSQPRAIWQRRPPPYHDDHYDDVGRRHHHHCDVADNALLEAGVGGSEVPVDMRRQDVGDSSATAALAEPGLAPPSYLPDYRPLARGPSSTSSSSSIVARRGSQRVSQYQSYQDHRYQSCESAWPARHFHATPSPIPSWRWQRQQHQGSFHPSYGAASRASLPTREEEESLPGHSRDVPLEASQCAIDGTCHDVRWGNN